MKVLLAGGGTIGSVSPLIAVYQEIKKQRPDAEFLWLATKDGPEKKLVSSYSIKIKSIYAGKLRRYFSLKNFFDPILIFFGFIQSLLIILKFKPEVILSAGSFVAVPVGWAGWLMRKKIIIHQQDITPGLANLLLAYFATKITVTFPGSLRDFPKEKTLLAGNPVRSEITTGSKESAYQLFNLNRGVPTILVIGGGTGALSLNRLVTSSLNELVQFCQVIHLTGGKVKSPISQPRYHSFDFLTDQLKEVYAVADLVISRGGLGTLTELAALKKPTIIIPIQNSHQEANAMEFFKRNAAVILNENSLTPETFAAAVKEVLFDEVQMADLARNLTDLINPEAAKKITELVFN